MVLKKIIIYNFIIKPLFISVILLLNSQLIKAQNTEYYIDNSRDTIFEKIKLPLKSQDIADYFYIGSESKKIYANSVLTVFKEDQYISVNHYNRHYLMRCEACNGYLKILEYKNKGELNYDGKILLKENGDKVDVPMFGFRQKIALFLKDCMSDSSFEKKYLKKSNLKKIVEDYNSCISSKTN